MVDVGKREDRLLDKISALLAERTLTTQKVNAMLEAMDRFSDVDPTLELVFTSLKRKLL